MSPWSIPQEMQPKQHNYKHRPVQKKNLLLSLLIPLVLAILSIPLYLLLIMKAIEFLQ